MSVTRERKLVTVLFCDLVGSTDMGEQLDPEAIQSVQQAYFGRMQAVVEQFGGTVEKFAGDAVVAVFGVPTLHEDDAERAVRCALEMQHALLGLSDTLRPRFGVELAFRIGVQTGEAVVSAGSAALATGDVMNTAARLEQRADPGQILVGHGTVLLTADAVEYGDELHVDAKGKAEPVRARPAVRLHAERRRIRSPLVGRARELELLAAALERAIARSEPEPVLVVGEPGIGKTRLAEEFAARARGRAVVLRGACLPYGEGSMWRPLEEVIRQDADIGDADDGARALAKLTERLRPRHTPDELPLVAAQLSPLAGVATAAAASEQELRWALGRYLQAIGAVGPVILLLDDLHWADDSLLDTLLELLRRVAGVPLVLVLQGRPELFERLTELHKAGRTQVVRLEGLSQRDSTALVENLAATLGTRWDDDVRLAVVARGEGSPLFLEEVAAMAQDEGLQAGVPRSLRALIAARLDLLPPDAKRVAQVAAVVGDVFATDEVADLAGVDSALPAILQLASRGIVDEEPAGAPRSRRFTFHHALIREVAYASTAKVDRSELHLRVAARLEQDTGRSPNLVLAIAHHLERGLVLRREVYPAEPAEPQLVEATVGALRNAAVWTGANAGVSESIELLRRATAVATESRELTALASAQLATMLARSGQSTEAVALAEEVLASEPAHEAAALASLALAEEARSRGETFTMKEAGRRALELAVEADLPSVELEALDIVGLAETWSGQTSAAIGRRQRATEIALELGDLPRAAWSLAGYYAIGLLDLGRLDDAERLATRSLELASETGSLRALESVHAVFSLLRRAQDRLEEAVEHGYERVGVAEKLGERLWLRNSSAVLAEILIDLGRFDEAWHHLDRALEIAREGGVAFESPIHAARITVLLAEGRIDEAAQEARLVDAEAGPFYQLAELRAAQGLDAAAEEIWQRVLRRMAAGEGRLDRAEMMTRYARFQAASARIGEARATLAEAAQLIRDTGATFCERQIRETEALRT